MTDHRYLNTHKIAYVKIHRVQICCIATVTDKHICHCVNCRILLRNCVTHTTQHDICIYNITPIQKLIHDTMKGHKPVSSCFLNTYLKTKTHNILHHTMLFLSCYTVVTEVFQALKVEIVLK